MGKRPTIRFSIDPNQKKEIDYYAKVKGFDNASNLARVALFKYMAKYKLGKTICPQTAQNGSGDDL